MDWVTRAEEEAAEKKAILFVGFTFFALSAYVLYESGNKIYFRHHPEEVLPGLFSRSFP